MNKINWKGETPIRLQKCLINEFGSEFDLNNKADRLAVREKRLIMSIPNFGRKSWKYLENYLLTRWPEDSETKPESTFKMHIRYIGQPHHQDRNLKIWCDATKGLSYKKIAEKYKLSYTTVRNIYLWIEANKKWHSEGMEDFKESIFFQDIIN
tara:strand:+ start:98 stop:556 length:459 start_codon:yes stop_codon:yes gene_type:complete